MNQADVVVVGGGPAGLVAAYTLAIQGIKVILLEKESYPHEKICGDGVTGEGLVILQRMGLEAWSKQFPTFDLLRLSSPDGKFLDISVPVPTGSCYGRTIPRERMDAEMAGAAVAAGVLVWEGVNVDRVEIVENRSVRVISNQPPVEAQLAILADGSHAPVTRKMGLNKTLPEMIAMRQYLEGDTGPINRLEIHFQKSILPGYNWLFPMGDGRVNAGVFTTIRRTQRGEINLRSELERYLGDAAVTGGRLVGAETLSPAKAHPLRTAFGSVQTHSERILVVGDAAELINPLSGEGIAPAMRSGEIAAVICLEALQSGNYTSAYLSRYSKRLEQEFGSDVRAAQFLRKALQNPALMNHIFSRMRQDDRLSRLVGDIIIGRQSPRLALKAENLLRLLF